MNNVCLHDNCEIIGLWLCVLHPGCSVCCTALSLRTWYYFILLRGSNCSEG